MLKMPALLKMPLAALALASLLALGLATPLRAAITFGGDDQLVDVPGNSSASQTLSLGSTGANAILFVIVQSQADFSSPTISYNGVAMTALGVQGTFSGGGTIYRQVYYCVGLTNNKTLSIASASGGSSTRLNQGGTDWTYISFTYNGVNPGGPIGAYSVGSSAHAAGSNNAWRTASFSFTPTQSNSTILELAMVQTSACWGNYNTGLGNVENANNTWTWSEAVGYGISDYTPGSNSAFTLSQQIKPGWCSTDIYAWGIELKAAASGTPTRTVTPAVTTPTPTPVYFPVPGTVQAEDYSASFDTDAANQGGQYRFDGTDIETTSDTGGGYDIGWTAATEWMDYNINVTTAGTYNLILRVAAPSAVPGAVKILLDGSTFVSSVNFPATGGWQTWVDVTVSGLSWPAGFHTLRIYELTGGYNLNYFTVQGGGASTPTATPTPGGAAATPTPGSVSVIQVNPNVGSTLGGNTVTISGVNFTSTTTFTFGGSSATNVTYLGPLSMTARAPAHSPGVVDVVATNSYGSSATSNYDHYTYVAPVYQGLSPTSRLYGLEYIPFPEQSSGGNSFTSLDVSFSSASSALDVPKNTARWKIELAGLSLTAAINNGIDGMPSGSYDTVAIETRIGPYGVSCTTGYLDDQTLGSSYSLSLPDRPQNLSVTYVFLTPSAVPATEQFDTMGDPRYVPYVDMMHGATTGFADNYNWFFRDLSSDPSGAAYTPFVPDAKFNEYNATGPNFDVPKIFGLIREGVMISRSVYTSISGWSDYYIGVGGEIGGDSSNLLTNGVPCYGGPWNSGSNSYDVDEIIGKDGRSYTGSDGASWVRNTHGWYSMPFIGELWPDNEYHSDWSGDGSAGTSATWGNLRNSQQGGDAYRDSIANFGRTFANGGNYSAAYPQAQVKHRNNANGCATFMNATDGSSGNTFNHTGTDYNANLLPDGSTIGVDFNFSMPPTFAVTRPWGLNWGGNTPQEWSMAPYNAERPIANAFTAGSKPGFYDYTGTESYSSAPIRLYDTTGSIDPRGIPSAGFFVVNGLAPSTQSGFSFVARFALLGCLRTFLDAGVPTGAAVATAPSFVSSANRIGTTGPVLRIAPIPRVEITAPLNRQDLSHYGTITINWKERYARWDDKQYTQNYPCLDGPQGSPCPQKSSQGGDPTLEWHDSEPLVFNVKYSTDQGATWTSCLTGASAQSGVLLTSSSDQVPYSNTYKYSISWDVTGLSAGAKIVRVECYRVNYPQHYAYHQVQITTQYP